MKGYWEPHTSSVDFCEPNYLLTRYIAEPHNAWSSLVITFYGIFGLLYNNPTNEWSIAAMHLALAVTGLGSVGLHSTINWILQSSDEVPMLWLVLSFLHILWITQYKHDPTTSQRISLLVSCITVIQTIIYYAFQQIYVVFITSFILYCAIVLFTTAYVIHYEPNKEIKRIEHQLALWSFVICGSIGTVLWILDMQYCAVLMPYYMFFSQQTGFTFHVFWHIFIGLDGYTVSVLLTYIHLNKLGLRPSVKWFVNAIPYCVLDKLDK